MEISPRIQGHLEVERSEMEMPNSQEDAWQGRSFVKSR